MRDGGGRSGFSLVEALFASAVLVAAIVPALLTFHAHLAAAARQRQALGVELALENLYSRTERRLLLADEGRVGSVSLAGPVKTVVSDPDATPCGEAELLRIELSAATGDGAIRREGLLYAVPPAEQGDARPQPPSTSR